jgi:hypothetical protein
MNAIAFSVIILAISLGPSTAQHLSLDAVIQIVCSAYQRQSNGTWNVLRSNKITRGRSVAREVVPGDDPEVTRLTDGTPLRRNLDILCPPLRQ